MVTYELAHDVVCARGDCECLRMRVGARDHDPKSGVRTVRGGWKRVAKTITLLAKGTPGGGDVIEGLPWTVQHLEAVIRDKHAGTLRVTAVEPPKDTEAESPPKAHGMTEKAAPAADVSRRRAGSADKE